MNKNTQKKLTINNTKKIMTRNTKKITMNIQTHEKF